MHSINTIIGKICFYPPIKIAISKNTRIVSFFHSSHYWGGQLQLVATNKGVTRGLKTNTESRFYALILQALGVRDHRSSLLELCNRPDATHSVNGLTPVNKDVITTIFDLERWNLTDQLIRICKPLVDIIGDVESRDANLADCMLQLIWAYRTVQRVTHQEGDDPEFARHAMEVLTAEFHALNTDLHWFALFLHPLCRKLAICAVTHSCTLKDSIRIAFGIAKKWNWSEVMAQKLARDLKDYFVGKDPFAGGRRDARDWWTSLVATAADHPLKAMAIRIFAIVPH